MPDLPFPDHVRELRPPEPGRRGHPCSGRAPVSVATWYLPDGDRVLLNMDHCGSGWRTCAGTLDCR